MSILQLLYNLFNWQYFGIVAIIWIVIDLVWVGRWKALIGRLGMLIRKPWIFERDTKPDEPPLYPRRFLEQLALNSRREDKTVALSNTKSDSKSDAKGATTIPSKSDPKSATTVASTSEGTLTKWANAQRDRVFDANYPLSTARRKWARRRSNSAYQTANFKPRVVGSASTPWVRPIHGVNLYFRASCRI